MLASKSDIIKSTASTMYQLTAEDKIRLQCEARERYEHDVASYIHLGEKRGRKAGEQEATNQLNQLNQYLIADGRIDELTRSTTDSRLQKKLLLEYQLISEDES